MKNDEGRRKVRGRRGERGNRTRAGEEEEEEEEEKCESRVGILTFEQIAELYEDFHVVKMPLLEHEVRGVMALGEYGKRLLDPHHFEV